MMRRNEEDDKGDFSGLSGIQPHDPAIQAPADPPLYPEPLLSLPLPFLAGS